MGPVGANKAGGVEGAETDALEAFDHAVSRILSSLRRMRADMVRMIVGVNRSSSSPRLTSLSSMDYYVS